METIRSYKMVSARRRFALLLGAVLVCMPMGYSAEDPFGRDCSNYHDIRKKARGDEQKCRNEDDKDMFPDLPIITSGYCDVLNSTNQCKFLAGRFEFTYDVVADRITSANEVHERVPVSYTPSGGILFNDRVINWAKTYTKDPVRFNLMNTQHFNWCKYAPTDNWPYRSAFRDQKSGGNYSIYFFNRQSCIYDAVSKKSQHFNTRFLHNSNLRLDLDYNPVIFPFRDPYAKEIRLVKHQRQHWYEVAYELLVNPTKDLNYFLRMDDTEKMPSKVNASSGPFFTKNAYRKFTNLCVSDFFQNRREGKNARLVQVYCGYDYTEITDLNPNYKIKGSPNTGAEFLLEIGLHTIPRYPYEAQQMLGVDVRSDENWERFANDGKSFSALTSKPLGPGLSLVFLLYSFYTIAPKDKFDEFYPMPYLAKYQLYSPSYTTSSMVTKSLKNLNYVDDIAYLHKCDTILIIFGPLYSETTPDKFEDLENRSLVGSIDKLGLFETTQTFFADPGTNDIYFYHRLNYIARHKYTCGSAGGLVTAVKQGSYKYSAGIDSIPLVARKYGSLVGSQYNLNFPYSEERFFKLLGVLNGEWPTDAPDPSRYPYEADAVPEAKPKSNDWLYYVLGIAAILIIIMAVLCLMAVRRIRKRRKHAVLKTLRSGLPSSNLTSRPTNRSGLARSSHGVQASKRSAISSGGSPSRRSRLSSASARSSSRPHSKNSKITVRSSSLTGGKRTSSRNSTKNAASKS